MIKIKTSIKSNAVFAFDQTALPWLISTNHGISAAFTVEDSQLEEINKLWLHTISYNEANLYDTNCTTKPQSTWGQNGKRNNGITGVPIN